MLILPLYCGTMAFIIEGGERLAKRFCIICGHYGSGKTNLALNLAVRRAESGKKVILADMDIVNPYFRSSDYSQLLVSKGIRVISPSYASTNLDTPSLPAELYSLFDCEDDVIIDVGGDDSGATALGRFHSQLSAIDYDMLYVINRYRSLTVSAQQAAELLPEIENACRLKATALVNNSHLKQLTTAKTITDSLGFADECARLTGLPLAFTTAPQSVAGELNITNLLPVKVYVTTPWENT